MDNVSSVFKGIICISLLAMAMSTAGSKLNVCSIIISHDFLLSIQRKENPLQEMQLLFSTDYKRWRRTESPPPAIHWLRGTAKTSECNLIPKLPIRVSRIRNK